jgi:enoyl-CoA hydratase
MTENVLLSTPIPGVTLLTLNRPDRLNAMNVDLIQDLHDALDAIDNDGECRVVVLTGAGRAFCAGLDLSGYGRPPTVPVGEKGQVQLGMATQQHIASLIPRMRGLRQPIIAAVNGAATGGDWPWCSAAISASLVAQPSSASPSCE